MGRERTGHRLLGAVGAALAVAGCSAGVQAIVDEPAPVDLSIDAVRSLSCELTPHHTAAIARSYEQERGGSRMNLTFAALDRTKRTAQLVGNQGSAVVTYEVASYAGNVQAIFTERTPSGSVSTTSVFFASAPPGEPFDDENPSVRGPSATAVHSRHILIGGTDQVPTAMVSQYVGRCRLG